MGNTKRRALKLYQKYIAQGSEFEINLSYNCRNLITKFFNNKNNMLWSNKSNSRPLSGRIRPQSGKSYSNKDLFDFDDASVDTHKSRSNHTHSHDDLSCYQRRNSLSSVVDEGFRGLKKSRSFHNVFEADTLFLEEGEEDDNDDDDNDENKKKEKIPLNKNMERAKVRLHDVAQTHNILDRLDDDAYLLQIFDDAAEEIYSVLRRDSLHRFYETNDYKKQLVPKYLNQINEDQDDDDDDNHDYDTDIVMFYFCKCRKFTDKKCKCLHKELQRESFDSILKRRKKQGMKRKPSWIKQRNKNMKNRKSKKKKIELSMSQINESKKSLISPLSITRRATKSISECITPMISNGDSKHNVFTRRKYHNSVCDDHWKLDQNAYFDENADDNDDTYFDDDLYPNDASDDVLGLDNKGVAIVRVLNVNVKSSPSRRRNKARPIIIDEPSKTKPSHRKNMSSPNMKSMIGPTKRNEIMNFRARSYQNDDLNST